MERALATLLSEDLLSAMREVFPPKISHASTRLRRVAARTFVFFNRCSRRRGKEILG